MKKIVYVFVVLSTMVSVLGLSAQDKETIVGKWEYEVAEAPKGYKKGVLEIKDVENALTGEVIFATGHKLKLQKFTLRNDTIWGHINESQKTLKLLPKLII